MTGLDILRADRRSAIEAAQLTPAERKLSGAAIQRAIVDIASAVGWSSVHWRAAKTAHGWRVPVEGSLGAGWPDLILANPVAHRLIAIEVKAYGDEITQAQADVLAILAECGVECYVEGPVSIRDPLETSRILEILTGRAR